jgi:hypothetical protein
MAQKNEYSTNLGLTILPEIDQQKNAEVWAELLRIRNALRVLQGALDTNTGALQEDPEYWDATPPVASIKVQNISRFYCKTSENLLPGRLINLFNSAGVLTARNANAADGTKPARAFSVAPSESGNYAQFILLGINPIFSGLVPGQEYYLATTSGLVTSVAPAAAGNIVQKVGFALSDKELWFNPSLNWTQL